MYRFLNGVRQRAERTGAVATVADDAVGGGTSHHIKMSPVREKAQHIVFSALLSVLFWDQWNQEPVTLQLL